jgi:hypothetical protein
MPKLLKSGTVGNLGGAGSLSDFEKSGALAETFSLFVYFDFNPANFFKASIMPGIDGINPKFIAAIAEETLPSIVDMDDNEFPTFAVSASGGFTLEASNPPGTPCPVTVSIFTGGAAGGVGLTMGLTGIGIGAGVVTVDTFDVVLLNPVFVSVVVV